MSRQIYTDAEASDMLMAEGHGVGDVTQELTVLVRSGLTLSQPPDAWLLTDDELDILRMRLRQQGA